MNAEAAVLEVEAEVAVLEAEAEVAKTEVQAAMAGWISSVKRGRIVRAEGNK
jgi:multidrug resistance efflux pump